MDRFSMMTSHEVVAAFEDAKFLLLTGCDADKRVAAEHYRKVAALMPPCDRPTLLAWMADQGLDVRDELAMTALYHHEPGRKYRPTRREMESGRYECPACHVIMILVTRKATDPLYRCPDCAWSIARSDIFEPEQGEEPVLRDDVEYPEGIAPDPKDEEGPW